MYVPARRDFTVIRGTTFDPTLTFTSGGAPIDLTGWGVRLLISDLPPLTVGEGLSLDGPAGSVQVKLTAAQTLAIGLVDAHWWLELTNLQGDVGIAVGGTMDFADP